MAFSDSYRRQVGLLLRTIPHIAREDCFALKGGTAINLFVRDLPRLSVDIDLTYVPVFSRSQSLGAIDKAMQRIAERIIKANPGVHVGQSRHDGAVTKLVVREKGIQIKIEVTPVLRGCVYQPQLQRVSPAVEAMFGFAEMQVVSFADLYAGKIVAALDRQHPRDLFDIRDLLVTAAVHLEVRSQAPAGGAAGGGDVVGAETPVEEELRLRGGRPHAGTPRRPPPGRRSPARRRRAARRPSSG